MALLAPLWLPIDAHALPSFARQTGFSCAVCHAGGSFPELTPTGREFKLLGYTLGIRQALPLAAMMQASMSATRNTAGADPSNFPRDKEAVLQAASLFYGGKITDHTGAFAQWTYDGVAYHSQIDNTDIRYANSDTVGGKSLIYGFTLNNNPTVQDVWNTTPAFGYPYASSSVAVAAAASTLIDGGMAQQVAGLGGYVYWNNTLYGELSAYRTADAAFSIFRAGTDRTADIALKGYAPYWRLAYERDWGPHALSLGTYGMIAEVYPDNTNPSEPTDRYKDLALDAQYQYLGEPHRFTAQAAWIHEKTDWNRSYPLGSASNPSDRLDTFRIKGSYLYRNRYGATLAYFSTTGDTDISKYADPTPVSGNGAGSPDTKGYILELDYLPWENIRLALQYTGYLKFNGARNNYDGFDRNASDNGTLYLLGWFMF